jgi:adenylate kinase family enzyme
MGLALVLAPGTLMGLFLRDPTTLAAAILPARIAGLATALGSLPLVLGFAFRGAGATKIAAAVPFISLWCLQLPLMAWIGLSLRQGLAGIVWVQAAVTIADALVLAAIWAGPWWTRVRIEAAAARVDLPASIRRVAILGGGGAGKSTLARRMGAALGLPVIHLDRIVFGPGWSRNPPQMVQERLATQLGEAWIVEGTYAETSALTLPQADLVLWLDQPAWLRVYRCWRKTRDHRGKPRADRPDGCDEGFGLSYVRTTLALGRWSAELERRLAEISATPVVRLRGDREVARLLAELNQPQLSTAPTRRAATGPAAREAG